MHRPLSPMQSSAVRHPRQGEAVKTILITLGILALLMFLACAGAGVAMYIAIQRAVENIQVTDPVKIRQVTSEVIDITIPAEFKPKVAHSIMGINIVEYQWCPGESCPPDDESILRISSFSGNESNTADETSVESEITDRFKDFKREDRELEIRGQKVKFAFVLGERHHDDSVDGELTPDGISMPKGTEPTQPAADPAQEPKPDEPTDDPTEPKPSQAPKQPTAQKNNVVKKWLIHGEVPGKKGKCTIEIVLTPEQYNDELIMTMLKSIR